MSEELISKKELLELTGISYGQLYRWKRKNLIPEEWFIRKSTFTGQETFFPKEKILERVSKIQEMKDHMSLDELANMFSPNFRNMYVDANELLKRNIVSQMTLNFYIENTYASNMNTSEFHKNIDHESKNIGDSSKNIGGINPNIESANKNMESKSNNPEENIDPANKNIEAYNRNNIPTAHTFSLEQTLIMFILEKLFKSGDINIEEGKMVLQVLHDSMAKIASKNAELLFIRKYGVSSCLLFVNGEDVYFEKDTKIIFKLSIASCLEELKVKWL